MRLGLHLLIVVGLVLPFEVNYWLSADLVRVSATVLDSRIVAPSRPRGAPVVSLDLRYVVRGHEHRKGILVLQPADGRYNWRPDERVEAEKFVVSHNSGSTVDIWVPRVLPGWSAALVNGPEPPAPEPRNALYAAYVGLLAVYAAGLIALKARSKPRLGAQVR